MTTIIKKCMALAWVLTCLAMHARAEQAVLRPTDDTYVLTNNGNDKNARAFLKFDISSIPLGMKVDSVFLYAHVVNVQPNQQGWDGDLLFLNVNSQTWTETDSSAVIGRTATSDSVVQVAGFASNVGWARSVNLLPIFMRDYSTGSITGGHVYTSIRMSDYDDISPNAMVMPSQASTESLLVGGLSMLGRILFIPHEFSDTSFQSYLTVFFSAFTGSDSTVGYSMNFIDLNRDGVNDYYQNFVTNNPDTILKNTNAFLEYKYPYGLGYGYGFTDTDSNGINDLIDRDAALGNINPTVKRTGLEGLEMIKRAEIRHSKLTRPQLPAGKEADHFLHDGHCKNDSTFQYFKNRRD